MKRISRYLKTSSTKSRDRSKPCNDCSKPETWLDSLDQRTRNLVFEKLRSIREVSDWWLHRTRPWLRRETIVEFEARLRAGVLAAYLAAINQGRCPTKAFTFAKLNARRLLGEWNAAQPHAWRRPLTFVDAFLDTYHQTLMDVLSVQ